VNSNQVLRWLACEIEIERSQVIFERLKGNRDMLADDDVANGVPNRFEADRSQSKHIYFVVFV
jgi:hypothetical protein